MGKTVVEFIKNTLAIWAKKKLARKIEIWLQNINWNKPKSFGLRQIKNTDEFFDHLMKQKKI